MKISRNIGIALAATALVFSAAAQAATRSSAAIPAGNPTQNTALALGSASTAHDDEDEVGGNTILLVLLLAAAVLAGIVMAGGGNEGPDGRNDSPG